MARADTLHRVERMVAGQWSPRWVAPVLVLVVLHGCGPDRRVPMAPKTDAPTGGEGGAWLTGTTDQRFALVAKHLRGLDVAMAETGYRYVELYWAGTDRHWGYAEYQVGKIHTAVANGVERRPRPAPSARMLDGALDQCRRRSRSAVPRRSPLRSPRSRPRATPATKRSRCPLSLCAYRRTGCRR